MVKAGNARDEREREIEGRVELNSDVGVVKCANFGIGFYTQVLFSMYFGDFHFRSFFRV